MNVQLPARLDKAAFLDWVERQGGRFELVKGRVVMMVGGSRNHGLIAGNLFLALSHRLDRKQWSVIAEFGLDAESETLRYPDIVVDRAGGPGGDRTATAPILLIEVLSPSTAGIDLGDKAAEYLRLPGLAGYLVFSQDEVKVWTWMRSERGEFSAGPGILQGREAVVTIAALGIELPLSEIYAEVEVSDVR
jgi:Uma2 family endonuclease